MMTQEQKTTVKKNLLAAQISYRRSELNEESLRVELSQFFQRLKKKVLKELDEYYNEEFMFQAHADLILAPIHESQKEYYNILKKHISKEYKIGYSTGKRYVMYAKRKAKRNSVYISDKAEASKIPISAILRRKEDKELFGTSEYASDKLYTQSFTASEKTMARVDSDINKILSDGYQEGWGQNKVAADLQKRFQQLQTWEARRIARTEIHNAHNMGIMSSYEDMDVSYTQWGSAHDDRVRGLKPKDKADHVTLDGEIIPFGAKYSNDLAYPGDTSGPIVEWINCRCVNMPFIVPDGYLAPSFHPFREGDLVATLDYWNADELIEQATQQATQIPELTEDEIRLKLSKLSLEEKYDKLDELLDNGAINEWIKLTDKLDAINTRIVRAESKGLTKSVTSMKKAREKLLNEMYQYERVIYAPSKPIPVIDEVSFIVDNQKVGKSLSIEESILEKKQIQLQSRTNFTWQEKGCVNSYGGVEHFRINGYIRNNPDWQDYLATKIASGVTEEEVIQETEEIIKFLDSAMERTPGLTQNSTIFRACDTFESFLRPGNISSFKGYGSCSFQRDAAEGFIEYNELGEPERYMLEILAPKGQKGIAMNDNSNFNAWKHEHEFLLPKNQKFQVLEVDHEKKTAKILLLD